MSAAGIGEWEAKVIKAISIYILIGLAGGFLYGPQARGQTAVEQNWIDAWNSTDPENSWRPLLRMGCTRM
jgi:hypothetical protein